LVSHFVAVKYYKQRGTGIYHAALPSTMPFAHGQAKGTPLLPAAQDNLLKQLLKPFN
jgi:hypothetical protein